jgi:hypothetical protein
VTRRLDDPDDIGHRVVFLVLDDAQLDGLAREGARYEDGLSVDSGKTRSPGNHLFCYNWS